MRDPLPPVRESVVVSIQPEIHGHAMARSRPKGEGGVVHQDGRAGLLHLKRDRLFEQLLELFGRCAAQRQARSMNLELRFRCT